MKKQNKKHQYWEEHYTAFLKSGLTQRAYCQENDLGYCSFSQWKRRLKKGNLDTSIQEIPVKYKPESSSEERIEIILEDRIKISLAVNISPEPFKNILSVLRELS